MSKTYYVYYDSASAQYYYYDAESTTRSWVYPDDGYVYEPTTLKPVYPPGSIPADGDDDESNYPQLSTIIGVQQSRSASITSVQEPVNENPASVAETASTANDNSEQTSQQTAQSSSPPAEAGEPAKAIIRGYMKKYIQSFRNRRTFAEYAETAFNKSNKGPLDQYAPLISDPLLKATSGAGRDVAKAAKEMYVKVIVKYVEAPTKDRKEAENLPDLFKKLSETPVLQEEAYCQIMRVIYSPKSDDTLYRGLQLLIFMATFFCPKSDLLAESIYTLLANLAIGHKHKAISSQAIFCFWRFDAIFTAKECTLTFHKRDQSTKDRERLVFDPKEIIKVPLHAEYGRFSFGVSLCEIHLYQGSKYPNLPVPKVVHDMAEKLFEMGAEKTKGIFRLPGNMSKIDSMLTAAEHENDHFMDGCSIHDVGSLFKQWFRDVPGCICGKDDIPKMMQAKTTEEIIGVADSLPYVSKTVLMYLVGFLRRLSYAENETSMNVPNLAMVFGPNLVWTDPNADAAQLPLLSSTANNFLATLIKSWDVSPVYPLQPHMLAQAEAKTG